MGSCQLDGLTSFVDKPHCARAPLAVAKESTSATNIDANLQFLDLMSFSSSAGENGILEKSAVEEPEPTHPEGSSDPGSGQGHALLRKMPLPADHEANRAICREGNREVVKTEV